MKRAYYGFRSFKWLMTVKSELIDEVDSVAFLCKKPDGSTLILTRLSIDPTKEESPWDDLESVGEIEVCLRGVNYCEALTLWWVNPPLEE